MTNASDIPWKRICAEAAAIVASILLAFAIDAWWEERKEIGLEQRLLTALSAEFEQNREMLRQARLHYEQRYTEAARILELIEGDPAGIDGAEFEELIRRFLVARTFHLESGAYDGVLASGELRLIRNEMLRNQLAAWPSHVREWSEEQEAVFDFLYDTFVPYLWRSIRVRNVTREFAPFPDGESPRDLPTGLSDTASLTQLTQSVEFDNLVYRRAQGLWYAIRDGETLLARLTEIQDSIRQNLDQ